MMADTLDQGFVRQQYQTTLEKGVEYIVIKDSRKYVRGRFAGFIGNDMYSYSAGKVYRNNVVIAQSKKLITALLLHRDHYDMYFARLPHYGLP
jgi:hypothetical protein